ncbi:MAG: ATP-binding cassette domain-containing protein [Pelagibacteraceae bacterium]|nr:ATP-binding cassette domain-containing protein [Pelagibacteraceae bacterium]PHX88981.1 MAG: ABC transporter ATP-binding protein [Pelagibacteraceae bacterium]
MKKDVLLKIENVNSGYGSTTVINNFSFSLNKSQILCITGRNGMGKTTLIKTIIGLIALRSGSIIFKNEDISKLNSSSRSIKGIGYVPQGREIFSSLTVEQNILMPVFTRKAFKYGVKNKLRDIYNLFPVLEEKKNNNGSSLSGGQQQQLAIARALIFNPEIIILDEPSEGIQPSIVSFIGETLKKLSNSFDTAFLVVEQNIAFISQLKSDCILVNKGSNVKTLTASQLSSVEKARELLSLESH